MTHLRYAARVSKQEKARVDDDPRSRALADVDRARKRRERADAAEAKAVEAARAAGVPWSRIGALYGLTKQGAQQRFKHTRAGG